MSKPLNVNQDPQTWSQVIELLPTVKLASQGHTYDYWSVSERNLSPREATKLGVALGEQTLSVIQRHPEAASCLRRILRALSTESLVAEGFLCALEDRIALGSTTQVRNAYVA